MIFTKTLISFSVYETGDPSVIGINLHTHHHEEKPAEARPEWIDQAIYALYHGVFPFSEEMFPRSIGTIKALRQICSAGTIVSGIAKDHGFTGYAHGHGITFHVEFPQNTSVEKKAHIALGNAGDFY